MLHKGSELSTSSDSCPTSRGFVDGCDDYDKMMKPPSPRYVHNNISIPNHDNNRNLQSFHQ